MPATTLAIGASGLRKEYGATVAVADLTLQVRRGEVFGFLGPNGAGKTTAVKMLLGLTAPTTGVATLLGKPLGDRQTKAKIGFLPEHFRFHEWLTAGEFLDLHGKLYGMRSPERAAVIPDLLQLVGLADQADVKLRAFSKGMLQRVGLAQSLLNDPELVFLDEPTSGLDPIGRRLVRDIINGLREEGTTVFLNSHLLGEVEKTCDRVAFIRQGTLVQTVSLSEFSDEAVHLTLRVGRPGLALLTGLEQFSGGVDGAVVQKADGRVQLTLAREAQVPDLVRWLVAQGHDVHELTPQRQSLEEHFMRIMGES